MTYTEEEFRKLKAEKERMDAELRMASQIQLSMLPLGRKTLEDVDIFGSLVPAREMGGDLFDYGVRDGKLFFCIGDVCGKGAPAAMLMAYAHAHLVEIALYDDNPASIVNTMNTFASCDNVSCTFFTLFFGVLNLKTGRLQYCNAAHNPPYILGDSLIKFDCDPNQPVGPIENAEFSLQEITVSPDSTIFLYTDGLTEAKNSADEDFGFERTEAALKDCMEQRLNPEETIKTVTEAMHHFTGQAEQSDDLTMIAVHYKPNR